MAGFVQDVMHRIRTNIPNAPEDAIFRIAKSICADYGGTEPYIGRRVDIATRQAMIAHGLRQQKPLPDVFAQAGVGRAHGYELLKRK